MFKLLPATAEDEKQDEESKGMDVIVSLLQNTLAFDEPALRCFPSIQVGKFAYANALRWPLQEECDTLTIKAMDRENMSLKQCV